MRSLLPKYWETNSGHQVVHVFLSEYPISHSAVQRQVSETSFLVSWLNTTCVPRSAPRSSPVLRVRFAVRTLAFLFFVSYHTLKVVDIFLYDFLCLL